MKTDLPQLALIKLRNNQLKVKNGTLYLKYNIGNAFSLNHVLTIRPAVTSQHCEINQIYTCMAIYHFDVTLFIHLQAVCMKGLKLLRVKQWLLKRTQITHKVIENKIRKLFIH